MPPSSEQYRKRSKSAAPAWRIPFLDPARNGGRVEKIEAPKGAELEPLFTHLRPNLEIRVSLSWVISGCFIEDVVEADLPDSAFARGDTLLAQATPEFRGSRPPHLRG